MMQLLWKQYSELPKKLDPEPEIPFLGIHPEGRKAGRDGKRCLYAQIHSGTVDSEVT